MLIEALWCPRILSSNLSKNHSLNYKNFLLIYVIKENKITKALRPNKKIQQF